MLFLVTKLAVLGGIIWYYDVFNKQSDIFGSSTKVNFEIKKAKDISQRLSDVKGINEIRDEI